MSCPYCGGGAVDSPLIAWWPLASGYYGDLYQQTINSFPGDAAGAYAPPSKRQMKLELAQEYAAEVRKRKGMNVTRVKT